MEWMKTRLQAGDRLWNSGSSKSRQRRFRDNAEADAGQGDAQLGGGDGSAQVRDGSLDRLGTAHAFMNQFLDTGPADGDQGKLGGDKQTIDQDQGRNQQHLQ